MVEAIQRALILIHDYFANGIGGVLNDHFGGNWVYVILFFVSLLFLYVHKEKLKSGYSLFFGFTVLGFLLFLFNPIVRAVFLKLPAVEGDSVYARFWLAFPIWMIVAYTLVSLCVDSDKSIVKKGGVAVVSILLVFAGNTIENQHMINNPRSIYKVNPDAIEIVDELLLLNNNKPVSLYIFVPESDVDDRFQNGGTTLEGITQYSGKVLPMPKFYSSDDFLPGSIFALPAGFQSYFEFAIIYNCDYIAFPDEELFNSRLEELDYRPIGHAGGYTIYSLNMD